MLVQLSSEEGLPESSGKARKRRFMMAVAISQPFYCYFNYFARLSPQTESKVL